MYSVDAAAQWILQCRLARQLYPGVSFRIAPNERPHLALASKLNDDGHELLPAPKPTVALRVPALHFCDMASWDEKISHVRCSTVYPTIIATL